MRHKLYVVTEEPSGRIKIGYTSQSPSAHKNHLQYANPDQIFLEVLREYPTRAKAEDAESFVHTALGKGLGRLWIRGEWYQPEALDMLDGILSEYEKQ